MARKGMRKCWGKKSTVLCLSFHITITMNPTYVYNDNVLIKIMEIATGRRSLE